MWQLKSSLSLGVSASGTAITLSATMGGMTFGSLLGGRFLTDRKQQQPLRIYAGLELIIGVSGLLLPAGFRVIEWIDSIAFSVFPLLAPTVHLLGIICLLGPPAIAMGMTLPIFGLIAKDYGTSIAALYGLNTGGAAVGVLLMAFLVVPHLGVNATLSMIASLNIIVALVAFVLSSRQAQQVSASSPGKSFSDSKAVAWPTAILMVYVTGFATFVLEVAWFRSMRAAFMSTTQSFAIILASVLVPLSISAYVAPRLRRRGLSLESILVAAGVATLLATPLVERMDLFSAEITERSYGRMMLSRSMLSLFIVGPPVFLLGIALPWLLEMQGEPRRWGRLYAVNTVGAIIGAITAAWVLLPWLGFAGTSWSIGLLIGIVGLCCGSRSDRWLGVPALALGIALAIGFESGLGRTRVQVKSTDYDVIAYEEGPDATVSVIEIGRPPRTRELIIDGCHASSEHQASNYMMWMGKLPMLAHPAPKRALVICFGTGQTANAVRSEGPQSLDLVELSPAVYRMAGYFESNEGVLDDPRVHRVVMDGRAWLRRCPQAYDVVTLEPMPPYFAGSNALYSKEFYDIVASRLTHDGVVAQWVPFHMLPPFFAGSIVATFVEVFPDSILWLDPQSGTGILLGRLGPQALPWNWPGFERPESERSLNKDEVNKQVALDTAGLRTFAELGVVITDDNQLLSYGGVTRRMFSVGRKASSVNLALVKKAFEVSRSLPPEDGTAPKR